MLSPGPVLTTGLLRLARCRSGRLSANELAGGMSVLAGKMNKTDKLNLMFDLYDRDR